MAFVLKSLRAALFLFLSIFIANIALAQPPVTPTTQQDTLRTIEIIQGKSLREKTIDSFTIQTIAGNVVLKDGLTLFTCDSAVINSNTNILEAFGNIHINQNDSIHTYAQYMRYIGAERIAYLNRKVKLTDKKGVLFTEDLTYDLKTNIGNYSSGGKVVNGKTVLTSNEGTYYADTKDVYFKNNVHLVDPKYNIKTDSLLYNTESQVTTFITDTYIKSKNGGDIYTKEGTYDLKNGKAYFGKRTIIKDSTRTYVADNSAYDEKLGIAQLEGNAIIKDSVNGYTVLGNQIYVNRNNESFLATRKPVLIFKGEGNDSTFIAADTLFSGIIKADSIHSIEKDTLTNTTVVTIADSSINFQAESDSTRLPKTDSLKNLAPLHIESDTLQYKLNTDSLTTPIIYTVTDTIKNDSVVVIQKDTLVKVSDTLMKVDPPVSKDTTIRYFQAFHHVRIFNDSLQAVCDSLYYSSKDSVFRLFTNPIIFSNNTEVIGDTIYMYTKNKKADRLYVFENGIVVNRSNARMYNQMAGRTLNGYFKDGQIDYIRVKGSPAESIYYPQDKDSAYIGMNRSKGDVIDVYFLDKKINRVIFINDVDGTLYPISQIPETLKYLDRYKWEEEKRPKNKLELFE